MTSANTSKRSYDLNFLLRFANILICALSIFLYCTEDSNDYVDIGTLLLAVLFAVENIGMLLYEKRRRNPFILILVFVMTVFYVSRIPTLIWMPSSAMTFQKLSITAADLNYSLLFILLANLSMFLGFHTGANFAMHRMNLSFQHDSIPQTKNAIIVITIVILINFFDFLNLEYLGRLSGFIKVLFCNMYVIILFTFTMLAYHYDRVSRPLRALFALVIICLITLITLGGSRSALLTIAISLLFSVLAVKRKVMISKRVLLVFVTSIPIAYIFFISATIRRHYQSKDLITLEHIIIALGQGGFDWNNVKHILSEFLYRIGFLDFSSDIIARREIFSVILNFGYYIKSVIDNVLTPGFDIFDTPLTSYSLSYIRNGLPIPSKYQVAEAYQSDQLGLYGEYYGLFYGFPALGVLCLVAFMWQMVYVACKTRNALLTCMRRALVLYLFYNFLNSFGMDWFIINNLVPVAITSFLFSRFYISKGHRNCDYTWFNNATNENVPQK